MNKLTALGLIVVASVLTFSSLAHAENHGKGLGKANRYAQSGSILSGATLDCVRTAVGTRETSVRGAYSTLTTTLLAGLDVRATALNAAWTLTDKGARKSAIDAAWSNWKSTSKSARETFKNSKKSTWETFRESVKTCKVTPNEVESTSSMNHDIQ